MSDEITPYYNKEEGLARAMPNREPAYISGKSGIELVRDCVLETTGK